MKKGRRKGLGVQLLQILSKMGTATKFPIRFGVWDIRALLDKSCAEHFGGENRYAYFVLERLEELQFISSSPQDKIYYQLTVDGRTIANSEICPC